MASQSLVRGHGHSSGLGAILDTEVKGVSALGRFTWLQLENRGKNYISPNMSQRQIPHIISILLQHLSMCAVFVMGKVGDL